MQSSASINVGVSCTNFNINYNYKLKTKNIKVNHNFKHIRQWSNSVENKQGEVNIQNQKSIVGETVFM